jgi:hypothetical protein
MSRCATRSSPPRPRARTRNSSRAASRAFEDWIAETIKTGAYTKVAVVEYTDEDDEIVAARIVKG